jgi:glutamine synthetase
MNHLLENVTQLGNFMGSSFNVKDSAQAVLIEHINTHIQGLKKQVDLMTLARKKANKLTTSSKRAHAYASEVKPLFETIRKHSDQLEKLVSDAYWPLVKYRELLQIK